MKKASNWLFTLALILSHSMVVVVAVHYVKIYLRGLLGLYAVPASSAWLLSIPFFFAIVVCLLLAGAVRRKEQKTSAKKTDTSSSRASRLFYALALVLSHSMVAVIGGSYVLIQRFLDELGLRAVTGTPPALAFLWVIPFGVGISLCLGMAHLLHKSEK